MWGRYLIKNMNLKEKNWIWVILFILGIQLVYFITANFWEKDNLVTTFFTWMSWIWTLLLVCLWFWKFVIEKQAEKEKCQEERSKKKLKIIMQLKHELEMASENIKDLKKEIEQNSCEFHNLPYMISPCSTWCWEREQDKLYDELKNHRDEISLYYKCCYEIDEHLKYAKRIFYKNVEIKNTLLYKELEKVFLKKKRKDFYKGSFTTKNYDDNHTKILKFQKLIEEDFVYDCTNQSFDHLKGLTNKLPSLKWVLNELRAIQNKLEKKILIPTLILILTLNLNIHENNNILSYSIF